MTVIYPRHAFNVVPGEPQPTLTALFLRRVLRMPWRKPAVPAGLPPAGADTVLIGAEPVLGDAMLSQVREQWNAWHDDLAPSLTLTAPAFTPSELMDTGEFPALDAKVDAVLRPVNGRSLGTQPRRHPELPETFDNRPGRDVLRRVLDGLRAMPVHEATSRGGWQ